METSVTAMRNAPTVVILDMVVGGFAIQLVKPMGKLVQLPVNVVLVIVEMVIAVIWPALELVRIVMLLPEPVPILELVRIQIMNVMAPVPVGELAMAQVPANSPALRSPVAAYWIAII